MNNKRELLKPFQCLVGLSMAMMSYGVCAEDNTRETNAQTESFVYKAQNPLSPTLYDQI